MDKEVDEIQQREALRDELRAAQTTAKNASDAVARSRMWLFAACAVAVAFALTAAGFAIALFGGVTPEPKCQQATIIGDNTVATAAPGTEPQEASTETYPLSVSIEGHKRCFVLKWDGSIDRDAECGYTVDFKQLRKALCYRE